MNKICVHCSEEITPEERINEAEGQLHPECLLRTVVGSLSHQMRRCSCYGFKTGDGDDPNLSVRENARQATRYFAIAQRRAAKAKFN